MRRMHSLSVAIGFPAGATQRFFKPDGSETVVKMSEPDEDGMQWGETP